MSCVRMRVRVVSACVQCVRVCPRVCGCVGKCSRVSVCVRMCIRVYLRVSVSVRVCLHVYVSKLTDTVSLHTRYVYKTKQNKIRQDKLRNIWKSNQYTTKTKIRLYNSNVNFILLYGSEYWRVVIGVMATLDAFQNGCPRKICRIFWPNKI